MANRLSREEIDAMFAIFQEHESIREVARISGRHHKTVLRYAKLERWTERLEAIRRGVHTEVDESLVTGLAAGIKDSLRLLEIYKRKFETALESKELTDKEICAAELERICKLFSFLHGGAESRSEVIGSFQGWSDEEVETYAQTGIRPTTKS